MLPTVLAVDVAASRLTPVSRPDARRCSGERSAARGAITIHLGRTVSSSKRACPSCRRETLHFLAWRKPGAAWRVRAPSRVVVHHSSRGRDGKIRE
ncbi:hypothetical protein MRX96_003783 [Rhipicephalus microplus]